MKYNKIVLKKLRGKLSKEEEGLFETWLKLSDKNRNLYQSLSDMKGEGQTMEKLSTMDIDKAWIQTLEKAEKGAVKKKVIQLTSWAKYAAVILLMFGGVYYFVQTRQQRVVVKSTFVTLETSDGSVNVIDEEETQIIVDADGKDVGVQEGTKIAYEKEIVTELVYNTLRVPNGRLFDLEFSDGTKVTLNSGSSIKYPVNFIEGKDRLVYLEGEAFFNVAKDSLHPFIVNSEDINIQVLGTQFCVNSYSNNSSSYAVLVEGSVNVYPSKDTYNKKDALLLVPTNMATYARDTKSIQIEQVDTSNYTNWMQKQLVFQKEKFKDVLNKIERHFDIRIVNNNQSLNNYLFTGVFTDESLSEVLATIQKYKFFEYTIESKTVTIKKKKN